MYGVVSDTYKNLVKLKTKNGEVIVKSNKKIPKGLRVEVKNIGEGDYKGKLVAGPKGSLPPLRYVFLATKITEDEVYIERISKLFIELEKRIKLDKEFLSRFREYFENGEDKEFEKYINILSGQVGFRVFGDIKVFYDRLLQKFEIFYEKGVIEGYISDDEITLKTSTIIENVEDLKKRLEKYFKYVFVKFEGFEGGIYV
ncbi:hypothetical protein SU69_07850 [Thermosipho melanesiensis]|uniref:Uncharacterized protein n=2 Tax=Thermosipho melanesiensis TaxID=46541 RepID=A6LN90_THEM4|nr:hypothetical protein [Thermosipho melanesiensis]ABR31391.1 hypothetical protein Tmel_1546 [Thermosipho melanesiensis BI429]APT74451.1 hypothetical protein BW47_08205 [Thermosipho melanesiensis]OOC36412.1 hypothetical protein SU68_07920 [Thermosipho melanesiensis]OOC37230.1 hypothetical protein SU69_07850 [Thermosipho melanesiensis]OOC37982.1 hypothetical protein SU70_07860 [Thermosipho melanesiensis]